MVAEDAWYPREAAKGEVSKRSEATALEQRQKAALLIKQQRQRIANLERQRDEDVARLREAAQTQLRQLQGELADLQLRLQQQVDLNASLHAQVVEQAHAFQSAREEMSQQLRTLEKNGRIEVSAARDQFEQEAQARIAAAVAEYKE